MDRCWLKGSEGDAIHAVMCAAGFNLRWLLRAVARMGITALFLFLSTALTVVGFLHPKIVASRQSAGLRRRDEFFNTDYSDPTKAERELGWKAQRGLAEMMRDAWRWQQMNPGGYGG